MARAIGSLQNRPPALSKSHQLRDCAKSPKSHPRKWVDCSDSAYTRAHRIPRFPLPLSPRVARRKRERKQRAAARLSCRPYVNNPHTAVWGIREFSHSLCVGGIPVDTSVLRQPPTCDAHVGCALKPNHPSTQLRPRRARKKSSAWFCRSAQRCFPSSSPRSR